MAGEKKAKRISMSLVDSPDVQVYKDVFNKLAKLKEMTKAELFHFISMESSKKCLPYRSYTDEHIKRDRELTKDAFHRGVYGSQIPKDKSAPGQKRTHLSFEAGEESQIDVIFFDERARMNWVSRSDYFNAGVGNAAKELLGEDKGNQLIGYCYGIARREPDFINSAPMEITIRH